MPTGRVHNGVASSYLAHCKAGERVPVFVRRSTFKLPPKASAPLIMVGPGTGLAPFRGFLQVSVRGAVCVTWFLMLLQQSAMVCLRHVACPPTHSPHTQEREVQLSEGQQLGPAVLFFGCRTRNQDYIYEAELAAAVEAGALSKLHVAFSRAGPKKDYVQHHMDANAGGWVGWWLLSILGVQGASHHALPLRDSCTCCCRAGELWALLQQPDAVVYVCGDAKAMAKDVHRALANVAQVHGKMSTAASENWVKRLGDSGRYHKDVW
jgi:NADPH-ferrihemoprotein reductase